MGDKVTFDPIARIIQIDRAPVFENGDWVVDIDIQIDIYSDGKEDWVASESLRKLRFPVRVVGGDPLPGSKVLGDTYFLASDWKIAPYEANHRLRVNGNFYSEDGTSPFNTTIGNYNVFLEQTVSSLVDSTVAQLPEIEYASFNGGVSVDTVNGFDGTEYPVGTPQKPCRTIADADTIATERGFKTFYILGDLLLNSAIPPLDDGHTWIGAGKNRTTITIDPDAIVDDSVYHDAEITGTLDGDSVLQGCLITNLNYVRGYIENCVLAPGTILLAGSETAHFLDCWSGQPGLGTPTIDMGGSGQALAIRNYNGGIKLINKTGPESVSIDMNSGQVIIDDTVTSGTIVLRGIGTWTNKSTYAGGANIINQLIDGELIQALEPVVFNETVHVDPTQGEAGIVFPTGTSKYPVNNFADAHSIAANNKIHTIKVEDNITIPDGIDMTGYTFVSDHPTSIMITCQATNQISNTNYENIIVTGAMNGPANFDRCQIINLSGIDGILHKVGMLGTTTLDNTAHTTILNSWTLKTDNVPTEPILDFNGSGASLTMLNHAGNLTLVNKTGPETVFINLQGSEIIIDDTVTGGKIVLTGNGLWENQATYAGGADIDVDMLDRSQLDKIERDTATSVALSAASV